MALKDTILEKLRASVEHISGQTIAEELGVSRAAVWKAVRQLKAEGHEIDSVSNKGYRLVQQADALDRSAVEDMIDDKTLSVFLFDSIDSTNNEAKRMLAQGFSENALIAANEQTGGRGRLGRSFYSPKNTGVYMTFLLQTDLRLSDAVTVTTAAAVAVVRAIERVTGITPSIKWVNDIYIGDRKVCGILTEAVSDFETSTAKSVIIGIGINITTTIFPDDIKDRASSLGTHAPVRNEIIAQCANELMKMRASLPDPAAFIGDYKSHSMILGKKIDFYVNNNRRSGTAIDIDDCGGLVVSLDEGGEITLSSGEVTVRLSDNG